MRRARLFAIVLLPLLLLSAPASLRADANAPTLEQMRLLERLPPAQRELLRRALSEGASAAPLTAPAEKAAQDARDVQPAPGAARQPTETTNEQAPTRLRAGDTVLIRFREAATDEGSRASAQEQTEPAPSPEERAARREEEAARERLRTARLPDEPLFELDQFGAVTINNVGRFALAGLSEAEAAARLAAEPAFRGLDVEVQRLALEPELERFGHDLFDSVPRTFAPAEDIPVPADYVMGPGDTVVVQLLGKDNQQYELVVTRDGTLLFPGIGPINVAGMPFTELRREVSRRVERQFIGTQASVTLGRLRSIRVFVLGDVVRPGSYTVSSLSTLTNALFASGGVKPIGSLRNIVLKRRGAVVGSLDLYDLLLHGDTRADRRLSPGDVIFVPPAGPIVGIGGQVRRPALYELKDEATLAELVAMAGGLLPDADRSSVRVERVSEGAGRSVLDVDLVAEERMRVQGGDVVRVYAVPERLERSVRLAGWVERPGVHEWRPGLRLSDLLPSLDWLRPEADVHYVLVTRERAEDRQLELVSADLAQALAHPGGAHDLELAPHDEVRVFGRQEDRAALIGPLLERARRDASPSRPWREVSVGGSVHHPGRYPWWPGMTVTDLIRAGGGLTERAYTLEAELSRFAVVDGTLQAQRHALLQLDPERPLSAEAALELEAHGRYAVIDRELETGRGDPRSRAPPGPAQGSTMPLQPHDRLVVRRVPQWGDEATIEILGEVRFPGRYPIMPGERLSQVLARAGGLTESAYARAAVFLRESVRQREQDYIEQLVAQLERDLALVRNEGPEIGVPKQEAVGEGTALLRQMRAAQATGRMVVDLEAVADARDDYDVVLQAGDKLVIPQRPDDVTVIGEVYYPTSHVYVDGRTRDDYVRKSGGITERGNKSAVYVVHADGSVSPPRRWFESDLAVGPGDTVIVPIKVDRVGNLKLFTDISTILFQLSVTAAALNSAGVF